MAYASSHLPPGLRTPLWQKVTDAAKVDDFILQVCQGCHTVQYPPREICRNCLCHQLEWKPVATNGELRSFTYLHVSLEIFFREYLPWSVGLVKLDCGPVMFTHLADSVNRIGQRIRVVNVLDKSGQGVFVTIPEKGDRQTCLQQFNMLTGIEL